MRSVRRGHPSFDTVRIRPVLTYPMQTMISVRERTTRNSLVTHSVGTSSLMARAIKRGAGTDDP